MPRKSCARGKVRRHALADLLVVSAALLWGRLMDRFIRGLDIGLPWMIRRVTSLVVNLDFVRGRDPSSVSDAMVDVWAGCCKFVFATNRVTESMVLVRYYTIAKSCFDHQRGSQVCLRRARLDT